MQAARFSPHVIGSRGLPLALAIHSMRNQYLIAIYHKFPGITDLLLLFSPPLQPHEEVQPTLSLEHRSVRNLIKKIDGNSDVCVLLPRTKLEPSVSLLPINFEAEWL